MLRMLVMILMMMTAINLMIGTTDNITKLFRKYLSNTLGKYNIMGLQNTTDRTLHTYLTWGSSNTQVQNVYRGR